jgi:chromosome segregation ATPase
MIELADAEARVAAVAKTLVDEIQSLTHTPQTVAPASSAALLERMEGLRAMCADGEHSAGEADSWAWGGFNSVVVAAADVTITTLRATAAIVEAADPEGAAAAKEELTAIRAKASALLNAVGADSADGDGLADRFAIANTKVAALQAGADMAASLASELAAAKVSLELAAFAGSKEQILNDRTALAAANASEAALADEVADLREKLVSADDMVAQLRDEVEVLDENSMVKVAQVRDMEGQVAQLEAEIASALTHTTELGDALTLAQHELASDDLRTQLETAEKEIVRLKKLLTDTNDARHNRLENENHGLRKAVDSANSERDTAVAARDRKAQSDAKDIAIEKSIRLQLAREKDEIQARLDKLIGADQFTEVLQQEKAYLEERVEELEHELAEQTARVAEIEIEMEEIGKRAAEEIQMRTAGAADKMQELEVSAPPPPQGIHALVPRVWPLTRKTILF